MEIHLHCLPVLSDCSVYNTFYTIRCMYMKCDYIAPIMFVHIQTYTHLCMVCVCVCMCVYMSVYVYIICIYKYKYTYFVCLNISLHTKQDFYITVQKHLNG